MGDRMAFITSGRLFQAAGAQRLELISTTAPRRPRLNDLARTSDASAKSRPQRGYRGPN